MAFFALVRYFFTQNLYIDLNMCYNFILTSSVFIDVIDNANVV